MHIRSLYCFKVFEKQTGPINQKRVDILKCNDVKLLNKLIQSFTSTTFHLFIMTRMKGADMYNPIQVLCRGVVDVYT